MVEALPIGDFTFLAGDEVASFHLGASKSNYYGYILEDDLKYPDHLQDSHSDYSLAAENLMITKEMFLAYFFSLTCNHVASEKLSPNLSDKIHYIVHYQNLRLYLKCGLQLVKVHRILKFGETAWRKRYIDFITAKRLSAKSSFLQSHFRHLNNMLFERPRKVYVKEWTSNLQLIRPVQKNSLPKHHTPLGYHQRESCIGKKSETENNRPSTNLSGLLYFLIIKNNHVQVQL